MIDFIAFVCIITNFYNRVMGVLLLADWVLIAIAAFFVEHAN